MESQNGSVYTFPDYTFSDYIKSGNFQCSVNFGLENFTSSSVILYEQPGKFFLTKKLNCLSILSKGLLSLPGGIFSKIMESSQSTIVLLVKQKYPFKNCFLCSISAL